MSTRPKNAAEKRNHEQIRFRLRQCVLASLRQKHFEGSVLSILSDQDIVHLADILASAFLHDESFTISVKRSK